MEKYSQFQFNTLYKSISGIPAEKRIWWKPLHLIGICFFCGVFNHASIFAASPNAPHVLRVSPVISSVQLSPGSTELIDVTVTNITEVPLPVTIAIEPFDVGEDDGEIIPGKSSTVSSLSEWIMTKTPDRIIGPQSSVVIPFEIQVPKTVPVGGYYAMAFVTPLLPVTSSQTPVVIPKIGILFLGSIGVPSESQAEDLIEIRNLRFGSYIYEHGPVDLSFRVKNISLMHQSVKTRVEITPLFGQKSRHDASELMIFPGKSRLFTASPPIAQEGHGMYKADIIAAVGQGKSVSVSRYIIVFPWKQAAGVFAVICILMLSIFRGKRMLRALKILIKG